MDVNPISVVKVLLETVKRDFSLFSSTENPTDEETQVATELYKQLNTVLMDCTFTEETVLDCMFSSSHAICSI